MDRIRVLLYGYTQQEWNDFYNQWTDQEWEDWRCRNQGHQYRDRRYQQGWGFNNSVGDVSRSGSSCLLRFL